MTWFHSAFKTTASKKSPLTNLYEYGENFARLQMGFWHRSVKEYTSFLKDFTQLLPFSSKKAKPSLEKMLGYTPTDALIYMADAMQRSIIFWDVLRKRGNEYIEQTRKGSPPVLEFEYKILIHGPSLKNPVNYSLAQILPPKGTKIDPQKRPFVIIDPRAGHVPGIGGFKESSQVGVSLRNGHPVYFVTFTAYPVPEQQLIDVTQAEILFLEEVIRRHPNAPKPCVVGNCQGGWAAMCALSMRSDLASSVILNGAPLSYWAGEEGKNPMRYLGGLLGGRWIALFLSDLGGGLFDGANLVSNFEYMNQTNTLLSKNYNLYKKVDTEEERFLKFERWWGSYSFMNKNEIDTILDNLFIGNKLSSGHILIDGSHALDLRSFKQPIFVFCSKGDTISPPHQSLQWIKDIHKDERSIKEAGQTIIYMVHESVGHLGIFVSGQIAQREYREITESLETFEALPPGLYGIRIENKPDGTHELFLEERRIKDLLPGVTSEQEEKKFFLVKMISDFNALGYSLFMSPLVQTLTSKLSSEFLKQSHYLRWQRYLISDKNPFLAFLPAWADFARGHRVNISEEKNIFSMWETVAERFMRYGLDAQKTKREHWIEMLFHGIYGTLEAMGVNPESGNKERERLARNKVSPPDVSNPLEDSNAPRDMYDVLFCSMMLIWKTRKIFSREEVNTLVNKVRTFYASDKSVNRPLIRQKVQRQAVFVRSYPLSDVLLSLKAVQLDARSAKKVIVFIEKNMALLGARNAGTLWRSIRKVLTPRTIKKA